MAMKLPKRYEQYRGKKLLVVLIACDVIADVVMIAVLSALFISIFGLAAMRGVNPWPAFVTMLMLLYGGWWAIEHFFKPNDSRTRKS